MRAKTALFPFIALLSLGVPGVANAQPAPPEPPRPAPPEPRPAPPAPPPPESDARTAENSIFLELLGNGGLYSINYEHLFADSGFGARVGFSYFGISAADSTSSASVSLITVPVLANYYIGGVNHKLQLGLGVTIVYLSAASGAFGAGYTSGSGAGVAGTGVIGYRYLPHDGGFDFGVGFTPLFGAGGFAPFGGIHGGYLF
jgi:hypothetical protein